MNLPDTPRSVALDSTRHVWVRNERWWRCTTDSGEADWAYSNELVENFGPITVIYDAGAELL